MLAPQATLQRAHCGDRPAKVPAILTRTPSWVPVLAFAAVLAALNPTVFVGGGNDDWHYLNAAVCVAEHGYCVARDHWASRFPVVLPTGAAIALFGKTKAALAIVPIAYAVASILLLIGLVERQFGRREAWIAGLIFVATPVISLDLVRLSVDLPELCYLLAAAACLQQLVRRGNGRWAVLAGIAIALAIETRATSLVAVPIFAIALLMMMPVSRRDRVLVLLSAGAILLGQAVVDLALAGDALHQWRLQLAHTSLYSSELPAAAAASGSPIFNIAIIDGWAPASGITVHWTIDGLLNLLAHPQIAGTIIGAALLLAVSRDQLTPHSREGRLLLPLIGAAALWFGGLVYALAVDPKPRMFEPVVTVAAVCIGVVAARRSREGDPLLCGGIVCALIVAFGIVSAANSPSVEPAVAAAASKLRNDPGGIVVDTASARFLAMELDDVPTDPAGPAKRLLKLAANDCGDPPAGWRLENREQFGRADWRIMRELRGRIAILPRLRGASLCTFRRVT